MLTHCRMIWPTGRFESTHLVAARDERHWTGRSSLKGGRLRASSLPCSLPGRSQEESVTRRPVLDRIVASVLPIDYLTPDAAPCGAGLVLGYIGGLGMRGEHQNDS